MVLVMRTDRLTAVACAIALVGGVAIAASTGCSAAGGGGDIGDPGAPPGGSKELVGADDCGSSVASLDVGATLTATADVNLRGGPSTTSALLHVVPKGSTVTIVSANASNDFYNVKHAGVVGWRGACFVASSTPPPTPDAGSGGDTGTTTHDSGTTTPDTGTVATDSGSPPPVDAGPPPTSARDEAVARAIPGVGFSYWWGHGAWLPTGPTSSTIGSCSGSCPSCTHSGSYGADCSGYVAKIWQVPASNTDVAIDSHPYSTSDFVIDASQWHTIDRGTVQKGDALVYHTGGAGHIFLYESGDGWGSMWTYEAKGCSYGITHDLRTAGTAYHAIAHY